jgi:lipopolysaccharide export system protein LptA
LGGGQEIDRVECEGSVRVQQRDRLAVGQKALYLARSQPRRLILTGEARVWEGPNSVTGHQVVYYLDQGRSQVESRDQGRVRAIYDKKGSGE